MRHLHLTLVAMLLIAASGCNLLLPHVSTMPVVHNPFPQLTRVAVLPFFNQSDEPTVDGAEFSLAYFGQLQEVPGYEVVPLGVVEETILREHIDLSGDSTKVVAELRRLGSILGVDAVVVGSVTDYSPYYPPRCGMRVEWYATNPGYHPIPAGYGLPWGTPEEEYIPSEVVFAAEHELARAQLATQSPDCELAPAAPAELPPGAEPQLIDPLPGEAPAEELPTPAAPQKPANSAQQTQAIAAADGVPPANWPDARGFMPAGPQATPPACMPSNLPVMTHTKIYNGHDPEFTTALATYVDYRDDARFGGWQSYLERSDDFVRFCCHMHITEMLTARGGATETRVVHRWSDSR